MYAPCRSLAATLMYGPTVLAEAGLALTSCLDAGLRQNAYPPWRPRDSGWVTPDVRAPSVSRSSASLGDPPFVHRLFGHRWQRRWSLLALTPRISQPSAVQVSNHYNQPHHSDAVASKPVSARSRSPPLLHARVPSVRCASFRLPGCMISITCGLPSLGHVSGLSETRLARLPCSPVFRLTKGEPVQFDTMRG